MRLLTALLNVTLVLALMVIVLGAYTRLTDAGLGCPDWPGCYGKIIAPMQAAHIAEAQEKFPDAYIEPHKARNEMVHRYLAGLLGLCVLMIFCLCQRIHQYRLLSVVLLLLVIAQAALGMWTVTLRLLPLIVLAHLFGGFALFSLLALMRVDVLWNAQSILPHAANEEPYLSSLLPFGYAVLVIVIVQIALGGWTSSNYAAAVCYQLPFCESGWASRFSLQAAFSIPLGHETYEHGVLPYEARMSIHVLHRMWALVTVLSVAMFLYAVFRRAVTAAIKKLVIVIAVLLGLQVVLGLINVVAQLPLLNAVAHNLVAGNLLMVIVVLLRQMYLRCKVLGSASETI